MSSTSGADLLETILAATRRTLEHRRRVQPDAALERSAAGRRPRANALLDALGAPGRLNVIAECKRRSPSRGVLRAEYDPVSIARAYEAAGASAVSVLTEPAFFDGTLDHLRAAREAVAVPLLRKDFIVDRYQLLEARAAGADAVLLIVAALSARELRALLADANALGLEALVEAHAEAEVEQALEAGATIVGVNNRNLRTLEVSIDASERLIERIPSDRVAVAESGLRTHEDLTRLARLGYRGFLVGERLMTSADPGAALASLLGREPNRPDRDRRA